MQAVRGAGTAGLAADGTPVEAANPAAATVAAGVVAACAGPELVTPEPVRWSAEEVVSALAARRISTREYVAVLNDRAKALNSLNAFISRNPVRLAAEAAALDDRRAQGSIGALAGLPIGIKDNIEVTGFPTTAGSAVLRGWWPTRDAAVVKPLRAADGLMYGKTHMTEFAFDTGGGNLTWGPAHNPYDRRMLPGGSSSGSAVAVVAGMVPAALGTDTGGSVRIPAALCGCVGFRPSTGRYPQAGIVPLSHTRDTPGLMARRVADIAMLDAVIAGTGEAAERKAPSDLRIGIPRHYFHEDLDDEVEAVVGNAMARLTAVGATLVPVDLAGLFDLVKAIRSALVLFEIPREIAAFLYSRGLRISLTDLASQLAAPSFRQAFLDEAGAKAVTAEEYRAALTVHRPALRALYERVFAADPKLDALLAPATPLPARPQGKGETIIFKGRDVNNNRAYTRNVSPPGTAGLPCLTLPAGLTAGGLPVGIDLTGRPDGDRPLIGVAQTIEAVLGPLPPPHLKA